MDIKLQPNITGTNVNLVRGATQADLTNAVNNAKTYRDEAQAFSIVSEDKSIESAYSALNASVSATTAIDKANIATNKATEANNSAINASASEAVCIAKATIATDKADIATAQSVIATDKANEASVSANTATTQAGIATTKASEASTSASNALTSENNADTSEANALIYRNQAESFANSINPSDLVHISGTETITGNKTFSGTVSGLTKATVGLSNVDNTSDANKPISTATQTALNTKVDKVTSTDNAVVRFNGTTGEVQNSAITIDDSGNIGSGTQSFNGFGGSGFKNYIINGDMRIDQWNNGAVVNVTGAGAIVPDRFQPVASQTGKITAQQRVSGAVSMGNAQFENCLQILTASGYSPIASDQFRVTHKIEGLNIANLRFGKSTAKKITLSFWVRSSVVGLHCVSFRNSSADRSYVATYTINTANNFEYKTITINGDTSGTWIYDTGIGLRIDFNLASGSTYTTSTPNQWVSGSYTGATGVVNDIATTGNEFIITGVQLEEGSIATPFENRPYGLELSLCQRYCFNPKYGSDGFNQVVRGDCYGVDSTNGWINFKFPVSMRTIPYLYLSVGFSQLYLGYPEAMQLTALSQAVVSCNEAVFAYSVASGNTANRHYHLYIPDSANKILFTSEL